MKRIFFALLMLLPCYSYGQKLTTLSFDSSSGYSSIITGAISDDWGSSSYSFIPDSLSKALWKGKIGAWKWHTRGIEVIDSALAIVQLFANVERMEQREIALEEESEYLREMIYSMIYWKKDEKKINRLLKMADKARAKIK